MEKTIEELVLLAKNNDEKAAEELIRATESKAYAIARALCRNEQDAKDAVQDCYLKAFSQLDKLNEPSRFMTWLTTMVRNACYDLFRSSAYAKTNVFSDISSENDEGEVIELEPVDMHTSFQPEVSLDEKTKQQIVFDILAKLPDEQRAAIVCMYYQDMKISDIAEEMQCSENTVKSRLNYARKKIAEEVEEYEKKYDIRLYNVAPLPLFYAWFTSTTKNIEVSMVNIITKKAAKKIIKGTIAHHSTKALLSSQAAQTVTKTGLSTAAKITISATVGIGVTAGITTAAVKVYESHEERTHNTQTISSNEEIPSTLIKDEVINPIIWAVDPDEHAYDNVESMMFLSGRDDDYFDDAKGLVGYPSQWNNASYSGNVLLGKCADGYTLFNYDGEELLDEHFQYIGVLPWLHDPSTYDNPGMLRLYCSNQQPWTLSDENVRGGVPITVNKLSYDYRLEETGTFSQYSEVGGPKFEGILIGTIANVPYETYLEIVQYQDNPPSYEEYGRDVSEFFMGDPDYPDKEMLYKVCSPEDYVTVYGAALVDKDRNICPTFNYQPAGLIVNGIVAVKNEPYNRYMLEDTFDRDFSKGEVANGGGLAVLNAYTGKLVTGFEYDALGVTTEGYTPVKKGDKWGLVRVSDGEVVIDCILDNVSNVYSGKVYVEYEGKKGVLALNTTLGLGIEINADTLS